MVVPRVLMGGTSTGSNARAAGLGVAAAAGLGALLAIPWLTGPLSVAIVVLVLVLLPAGESLAARVAVVFAGFVAWSFALFLLPRPATLMGVPRLRVALAVVAGTAVASAMVSRTRGRPVLPRFAGTDALVLGGGVIVTAAFSPLWWPQPGAALLARLIGGWDHAAHFSMVQMARLHGRLLAGAPPELSDDMSYSHYPQGFHGAVVAVLELRVGPDVAAPEAELLAYGQAVAVVLIAALTALLGAVAALDVVRRTTVRSALVLGSLLCLILGSVGGGSLVPLGFPNFLVACTMVGVAITMTAHTSGATPARHAFLLGTAGVGVAQNWALLLILVLAALPAVWMSIRSRWGLWPYLGQPMTVVAVVVAFSGVLHAVALLRASPATGSGGGFFFAVGGFRHDPLWVIGLLVATSAMLCAAAWARASRVDSVDVRADIRSLSVAGLVPLIGGMAALALGWAQLARVGDLRYYLFKFASAVELAAFVVIVLAGAALVATVGPGPRPHAETGRHPGRYLVTLAVGLTVTVVVGVWAPSDRFASRQDSRLTADERARASEDVLAAARLGLRPSGAPAILVPRDLGQDPETSIKQNLWLWAFNGDSTLSARAVVDGLWATGAAHEGRGSTVEDVVTYVVEVSPSSVVLVHPEVMDAASLRFAAENLRQW